MRDVTLQPLQLNLGVPDLERIDYRSSFDGLRDWAILKRPAPHTDTWVICLHGFQANAKQLFLRKDLKQCWLPRYLQHHLGILSPQLRGDAWMNPAASHDLTDLIDFLAQLGAKHIILESGSMGATSSLLYASSHPERISALIARAAATDLHLLHRHSRANPSPLSQALADSLETAFPHLRHLPEIRLEALRQIPLFLAHGTHDDIMPIAPIRRLVGTLHDHPRLCYCELPNGDHESPLSLTSPDFLALALHAINA